MGDEMARKVLQAEAVGPMTCVSFLLSLTLRPRVPIFRVLRSCVPFLLEWVLSWNGSCVWIMGGEARSVLVE